MLPIPDDTIKSKLNKGKLAGIESVEIALEPDAVPIRIKQKYAQLKLKFLNHYIRRLPELGFVKTISASERVFPFLVVPKHPPPCIA